MTKAKKAAQEERVVICIRHAGQTWKLAWFNENAEGVYSGVFGRATDTHSTYHVDGTNTSKVLGKPCRLTKLAKLHQLTK